MAIEPSMAAKAAAGVCAAAGGCGGIYCIYHYATPAVNSEGISTQEEGLQPSTPPTSQADAQTPTSKYDDALIEFLKDTNRDIVFDVQNDDKELTTETLTFLEGQSTFTVKAAFDVNNNEANQKTFRNANASQRESSLKTIKSLNNGSWTWTCTLKLHRVEGSNSELYTDVKKRIYSKEYTGLFALLKKDASSQTGNSDNSLTREQMKDEKIEFIKRCAKARTTDKNKALNEQNTPLEANSLDCPIPTLELRAGSDVKHGFLVPKDETRFDEWFKEDYAEKVFGNS